MNAFIDHMVPMSKEELNAKTKAMRNGQIKMRREGCYWSPEEDEAVLFKYYKLFKSTTEIAIEHERNESGILQRIGILDAQQYGNQKRPNRKKKSADPPGCLCKDCKADKAFCPRCPHYLATEEEA